MKFYLEVAEKYKQLLIVGNDLLKTQEDKFEFTQVLSKYITSKETIDDNIEYINLLF